MFESSMAQEEIPGADDLSASVFRAFVTTLRLHQRLMFSALAERGMHPGQSFCLRFLSANDGLSQRDLAEGLHIAAPTASKMLRTMQEAGLVDRRPDATDHRLTRVFITPKGRTMEMQLHEVAAAYANETIATLPEEDRRELVRLLRELGRCLAAAFEARQAEPPAEHPEPLTS
jgi:MarR family transcriptional regulator, organic hydroperoxide resistance regulator